MVSVGMGRLLMDACDIVMQIRITMRSTQQGLLVAMASATFRG
jgi:hypothetical protein